MVKYKSIFFILISSFFLLFSFYPTIFELSQRNNLLDQNREFILEHNYYWPDYNLYLSKIRQGYEGKLLALEKYTTEKHQPALIQEFYVVLGQLGRLFKLEPNFAYLLGRIILSPALLVVVYIFVNYFFKTFTWKLIAFIIVISSGSFPRLYTDNTGLIQVGRYMEWWSNIDALQRLTFIPHILFGQVVSLYLLYQITNNKEPSFAKASAVGSTKSAFGQTKSAGKQITRKKLLWYIVLGNIIGLVFPPSLITLNGTLFLLLCTKKFHLGVGILLVPRNLIIKYFIFLLSSSLSLVYIFIITRQIPWSALVDFHKNNPMMIPLDQYLLGTGPIVFLGFIGMLIAIFNRKKQYLPLILWVVTTIGFASFFSIIKEQSPLRFTQTGLFIPLGILTAFLFKEILAKILLIKNIKVKHYLSLVAKFVLIFYISESLFMMKVSFNWQLNWITQRLNANIPLVPYPPQAVYPLKNWIAAIRFLRDNTNHADVVIAAITAGNYIPAYSGNTVYFGQANTVDYNRKQIEVNDFFKGKINPADARMFLTREKIKFIFFGPQEMELANLVDLKKIYPFLQIFYQNQQVTIYTP